MEILVPEAMTRFQCNQQGCCCKGWAIHFEHDCLVRLLNHFPNETREKIIEHMTIKVSSKTGKVRGYRLQPVGEEKACQFLCSDGRCEVHAEHGVGALPKICRSFPSHAQVGPEGVELHYDAVCPEVLNQLDESDGPLELVRVEVADDSDMGLRAGMIMGLPPVNLGPHTLEASDLTVIRARLLEALERASVEQRPALDALGWINYSMAGLVEQEAWDPDAFEVRWDDAPLEPFDVYFDRCVRLHDPYVLADLIRAYRRFVFALDLSEGVWSELPEHMSWEPDWRNTLDPRRADLQPLLLRYLAHRIFSAFDRVHDDHQLHFNYGTLTHALGTTFRLALGLSAWLERPIDRAVFKVAIGAAEYFYRTVRIPAESMPWFGIPNTPEGLKGAAKPKP